MKYAKPQIEIAKLATHAIETQFQKEFWLFLDGKAFVTPTAYESDE